MKNTSTEKQNQNEEQKFEQKLFHSLQYYGYLFPNNEKDIKRFDELYGDTEIDFPDHLKSLDMHNSDEEFSLDYDFSFEMAAFSADESNHFELPEDFDLNENDENENNLDD